MRRTAILFAIMAVLAGSAAAQVRAGDSNEPALQPERQCGALLALGDSLTAGYNLPQQDAFPVLLQAALVKAGYTIRVINGGVSGDTAADARARLDWVLADHPNCAIVELGANDFLRGFSPKQTYVDLDAILAILKARGVKKILLAGMKVPRNYGKAYVDEFEDIYPRLAEKYHLDLYPFFLEGVALDASLTLPDGMHPNAKGVAVIVKTIMPAVVKMIGQAPAGGAG